MLTWVLSESEEVTDTGSHHRGSEPGQIGKASSHIVHINSSPTMRRMKSDPLPSSSAVKMASHNMFPKGSNGIRKEPKGVRMAKEAHRIFKDLSFCKANVSYIKKAPC